MAAEDGRRITDENLSEGMAIGEETSPSARRECTASINRCREFTASINIAVTASQSIRVEINSTASSVTPRVTPPSVERLKQGVVQAERRKE